MDIELGRKGKTRKVSDEDARILKSLISSQLKAKAGKFKIVAVWETKSTWSLGRLRRQVSFHVL